MDNKTILTKQIKEKALSLGFNAVGITNPKIKEKEYKALVSYLEQEYQGTMSYLADSKETRKEVKNIFPEAKSILIVLSSYFPQKNDNDSKYKISYYTYGNDYHYIIKKRLGDLLSFIKNLDNSVDGISFCDTSAVFEKAYAVDAGLGWIGKNSLLINKESGSFVFIGGLILNIDLEADKENIKTCPANCNRCIDACPTKAIIKPYVLNASKCISYLTIEKKDDKLSCDTKCSYIAGCDICQKVCPYNQKIDSKINQLFKPLPYVYWKDDDWEKLTTTVFKKNFGNTSIKRIGLKTLNRNIFNIKYKE